MNLTILGAGSFGTAMANHAAKLGHDVRLWCRNASQAETINTTHYNPRYLKGHKLHEEVRASADLRRAVEFSDKMILAVPTQSLRVLLEQLAELNKESPSFNTSNTNNTKNGAKKLLSLAKGIEIATGQLPHQVAEEVLPQYSYSVLSGPSHAEEVVLSLPTAVVVASKASVDAQGWQTDLNSPRFRIYTSEDLKGVELGGAVKNIIAIAVGIAQSLNFGDNAMAALTTRGLAEIMRLGSVLGAAPLTLAGLAGVGDLMVTCYSHHSRNLRFGLAIGRGLSMEEAASEIGQVVEGAHTVKALVGYARKSGIELPVAEGVYSVLYEGASVAQALEKLLFRDPKPELQKH